MVTPTLPPVPGTEAQTQEMVPNCPPPATLDAQGNCVNPDGGFYAPTQCAPGKEFVAGIGCVDLGPPVSCQPGYYHYAGKCYPESGYTGQPGTGNPTDPIYGEDPWTPDMPGGTTPTMPAPPPDAGVTDPNDPYAGKEPSNGGSCFDAKGNKIPCPKPGDGYPVDVTDPGDGSPPPVKDNCIYGTWDPEQGVCFDGKQCFDTKGNKIACPKPPPDGSEDPTGGCGPGMRRDPNTGACVVAPPDYTDVPTDPVKEYDPTGIVDHNPLTPPEGSPDPKHTEGADIKVEAFDYGEVQNYIDDAMEQANRYLEPQEQLENERHKQELINQGIDPNSPAGIKALQRLQMGQNDRRSKATYDAIASGMAAREQMFGEGLSQAELDQEMNLAINELEQRGYEFDTRAILEYDKEAWKQLMDVNNHLFEIYQHYVEQENWEMAMAILLAGGPGGVTLDPTQ